MINRTNASPRSSPFIRAATVALALCYCDPAPAQSELQFRYRILFARVTIGTAAGTAKIGNDQYSISVSGNTNGFARVLASGNASATARGVVRDGQLVPEAFNSISTFDNEPLEVNMALENGNVLELATTPSKNARVAINDTHRQAVIDPLSGLLISNGGNNDGLTEQACNRTLPIFDGYKRYNLHLKFKSFESIVAGWYNGPSIICSGSYKAIAGHRAGAAFQAFLSEREIEIAFVPIKRTRFLAPTRVTIRSLIGNLVIDVTHLGVTPGSNRLLD